MQTLSKDVETKQQIVHGLGRQVLGESHMMQAGYAADDSLLPIACEKSGGSEDGSGGSSKDVFDALSDAFNDFPRAFGSADPNIFRALAGSGPDGGRAIDGMKRYQIARALRGASGDVAGSSGGSLSDIARAASDLAASAARLLFRLLVGGSIRGRVMVRAAILIACGRLGKAQSGSQQENRDDAKVFHIPAGSARLNTYRGAIRLPAGIQRHTAQGFL
ncbi:MAG TPA: hypothetical protein VG345_03760 [Bryobacteraceae bacterium]|nr:hypothetical protein [Bryobacteraceae bacterium]